MTMKTSKTFENTQNLNSDSTNTASNTNTYTNIIMEDDTMLTNSNTQISVFSQADSYEDCAAKLNAVLDTFPTYSKKSWEYFLSVYDEIPVSYRMRLMIDEVYRFYPVDYVEFLRRINRYIHFEETPEIKEERVAKSKELLKEYMENDGSLYLYRAMKIGSLALDYAVNFFADEESGMDLVDYYNHCGAEYADSFMYKVDIDSVLYVSEYGGIIEVFVVPKFIWEGDGMIFFEDDIENFGLADLEEIAPDVYERILSSMDWESWGKESAYPYNTWDDVPA